jgi:hypothetical protein
MDGGLLIAVGYLLLAVCVMLLSLRVDQLDRSLKFYEKLIQHSRTESRVALSNAQQARQLITSAVNGAQARRAMQGGGQSQPTEGGEDESDLTALQLLEHRIRYRQSLECPADELPLDSTGLSTDSPPIAPPPSSSPQDLPPVASGS